VQKRHIITALILGAIGLSQTAKADALPDGAAAYASDLQNAKTSKKLIVKGFFLGMTRAETRYLISTSYSKEFSVPGVELNLGTLLGERGGLKADADFAFDQNDRLISYTWGTRIVNPLFNVPDMTPNDFAQSFSNNYPVPTLDWIAVDGNKSYWAYASPDGWKVIVFEDKSLRVFQIPASTDRKFN